MVDLGGHGKWVVGLRVGEGLGMVGSSSGGPEVMGYRSGRV